MPDRWHIAVEADEFSKRRRKKARQKIGAAVAEHLGITAEGIGETIGGATCPDQIRDALCDAFDRGRIIRGLQERQAAEEDEPGRCCNQVCRNWVQSEGEALGPSGEIVMTGRQNFCSEGGAFAVGCLYRMRAPPPNHLDGETCAPIPEWSEAINLLRQNGLLEPDEQGRWNGTDLAFKVRRLWWALVELLVESGRIDRCLVDDGMEDRGEQARLAKALLFPAATNPRSP